MASQVSPEEAVARSGEVMVETKAPSFDRVAVPTFCYAQGPQLLAAQRNQKGTRFHLLCLAMAKGLPGRLSQIFTTHLTRRHKVSSGVA